MRSTQRQTHAALNEPNAPVCKQKGIHDVDDLLQGLHKLLVIKYVLNILLCRCSGIQAFQRFHYRRAQSGRNQSLASNFTRAIHVLVNVHHLSSRVTAAI